MYLSCQALNSRMTYLTKENFNSTVESQKTALVLFSGRWSVLGGAVATKLSALDATKVSVFCVDIDSSDGAQIAISLSIRESPYVILFESGVPKLNGDDLTDEMVELLK
jgi:thioredoxin-like negative regulator of GroEL